ncbi:glycosyltransferase [Sinomonas sp. B1-1]|uniref:glycosyltransferase n=1 Tax=Sinomonas sp. B1-1 TaxID=3141454 RepID=UPI003D266448
MKILHIVTHISSDGAFGGPSTVALGQAEALAALGHEVTVYAAAPSAEAADGSRDGFRLRTFPERRLGSKSGFAFVYAPSMLIALAKNLRNVDVVHLHLARDLVVMPAAWLVLRSRARYVVQPHGMLDRSSKKLAFVLDLLATKPVLRKAFRVLVLTREEAADVAEVESSVRLKKIANGIKGAAQLPAHGRENNVVFLARLHPRKRPLAFVEMASLLAPSLPQTNFIIAGPDEGEGAKVREAIQAANMGDRLRWIGPVPKDATEELLATAGAFVLPAVNEVFPMTILESIRVGTPVVTTDSLGIAEECVRYGAAAITTGSPIALADAVLQIMQDPDYREQLVRGGYNYMREHLDISAVAQELVKTYSQTDAGAGCVD